MSAEQAQAHLGTLTRALNAVSPLATLDRGFAIVAKPDGSRWGQPVASVGDVERGDAIVAHLADGAVKAIVEQTDTPTPKDG